MPDRAELIASRPADLAACCEHLAGCPVFGFDTEFIGENTYHPHLCLVQVATPERLYLIDPLALESLEPFWELVADPGRVAVVHAGREEIRMCRLWSGRTPGNLFDLQVAAGLVGVGYPAGHGTLVQQLLRVRLEKAETLTDWARRPLTPQQVKYAYDDVRYLLALYDELRRRLDQLGRAEWAAEEFRALTRRALQEDPASEPWRKLRGLGSLTRKQLAMARELFIWRDDTAERLNRPARFILRDDLIVEVTRRNPHKERDLAVLRGFPRNLAPEVLNAVALGRATLPDQLPRQPDRDNDPPQVGLVTNFLLAVLGGWCAGQSLTPGLAATTQDVKLLVRARLQGAPLPEESILTSGWRAEHVLPMLLDVLDGRNTVRIRNLNTLEAFELGKTNGR